MGQGLRKNAITVIERLPKGARGAEIGTHRGRWTQGLRDIAKPSELTLIDPWAPHDRLDSRALAFSADHEAHEANFQQVSAGFPEATLLRMRSSDALATMGDQSLDWIFLDGDKQYDVLLSDLEQAVRVIRPGGMIAGGGWHFGRELGWPVRIAVREIATRLGIAAVPQNEGMFWSLTLSDRVELAPRPARDSFLVISTMKNEAPYILEWVAHNRALGFTDFLIFTNDCDDTTDPILDRLEEMGIVTHVVNNVLKRGPHKSALKWAADHVMRHKAEWVMICDVDEFINLPQDASIPAMLDRLGPDTDVVSFPWKIFGNGGIEGFEDKPITAQFTRCEPAPYRGGRRMRDIKTLYRRFEAMYHIGLHRPRVRPEWRDRIVWKSPSGEDISAKMNPGKKWVMKWDGCQEGGYMHHYPLRSLEAYILKKNRGRANHIGEDLGREYWDKWNMNEVRDGSLKKGLPGFADELAALMSDRKLRRLHRQGVAWHREQFETLMQEPAYRDLWNELRAKGLTRGGDAAA